jgi:hypothetical protein
VKLSCKISSAVLEALESSGEDLSWIFDHSPVPLQIFQDPSAWVFAHEMEAFLGFVKRHQRAQSDGLVSLQDVGHQSAELKAWGILDHVLRMMPKPYEVFYRPESFIAYFVSPKPPVENFCKLDSGVEFDWPLVPDQLPLVSEYLKAAFESIPTFVGQPLARCHWEHIHVVISWAESQSETLTKAELPAAVSPEVFSSVIQEMQKQREQLEERNQKLQLQNEELHRRLVQKRQFSHPTSEVNGLSGLPLESWGHSSVSLALENPPLDDEKYKDLTQNLVRLNDYMYRAQQVVTILTSTLTSAKPTSPQRIAKQVLRKVDWEHIRKQVPFLLQESFSILRSLDQNKDKDNKNKSEIQKDGSTEISFQKEN